MWYEVKLTTQAIEQIQEIVRYISHILLVPETARKWADTLQSEIAKLDFYADTLPSYRGRALAYKRNTQNDF